MQSPPFPRYLVPPRYKYSPQQLHIMQCVPLTTESGISSIIWPLMRILQRNLKRTTDTFLFISHTTNVLLFKFRCNIVIGVRIIKEMPGSVASGTHCIATNCNIFVFMTVCVYIYIYIYVCVFVCVYIYIYTHIHTHYSFGLWIQMFKCCPGPSTPQHESLLWLQPAFTV